MLINSKILKNLSFFISIIFLIYDGIEINGINLKAVIPELLMVIYDLVIISKSIKEVKI